MELVEVPCGLIAVVKGKKGMSFEEGGSITLEPSTRLSVELWVRTEVFEKINYVTCPKFV